MASEENIIFPIAWLTYKQRIKLDLQMAYSKDVDDEFFNSAYLARIATQAKQLEDWLIKLFVLQIALTAFQVVGFIGNDASISLFGITLKQASGVKEIVLAFFSTVALVTWMVIISRDTCLTINETLIELATPDDFVTYDKIAGQTPFNLKVLFPRIYQHYLFPTFVNKLVFIVFVIVGVLLGVACFVFSLAVNIYFFRDIYRNPTLGVWSNLVLGYVSAIVIFGLLYIVRFYIPQPFRDQRVLFEIDALKGLDEALYRRKLAEVYGPNSKFRKRRWLSSLRARFSKR